MRIRGLWIICGSLLLFVIVVGWLAWRRPEPVYRGKPVSYWIREKGRCSEHPVADTDFRRARIIYGLDARAVPYLIEALERHDHCLCQAHRWAWYRAPRSLKARLPVPVDITRLRTSAAVTLGDIGPDARPAVQLLSRVAMRDSSESVRLAAVDALGRISHGDQEVRVLLTNALQDKSRFVQIAARQHLGIRPSAQ